VNFGPNYIYDCEGFSDAEALLSAFSLKGHNGILF